MNMDETLYNNEERINRYLQGKMTQEEEGLFEEDLAKDETLRRQAEAMARIVKVMEVVGKEHDIEYIQKMKEAYYYFIRFEADVDAPAEIESRVRIMDGVIRYLVVRQDEE